jgi:hypothetical protein
MLDSKRIILLCLVLCVAFVGPASAQQWFDFNAQVLVPTTTGDDLTLYGVINNNGQVETPLPLDFANNEYTIVVTNLTLLSTGFTEQYAGGTISIYEDAATAADYSVPGTFSDGVAIMSGDLVSLGRTMFTATMGSVSGSVDWDGGSRVGEIAPADRLGWSFLSGVSTRATVTVAGYDENWDGKTEPQIPIVPTADANWGEVKSQY